MKNQHTHRCSSTTTPSKNAIFMWLKTINDDVVFEEGIEELGNGVMYCQIINYYHAGTINSSKVIIHPKN